MNSNKLNSHFLLETVQIGLDNPALQDTIETMTNDIKLFCDLSNLWKYRGQYYSLIQSWAYSSESLETAANG